MDSVLSELRALAEVLWADLGWIAVGTAGGRAALTHPSAPGPGDPGIPPAEPHGEGAALLQLRRLWDPICGPGEWHCSKAGGSWRDVSAGKGDVVSRQVLIQLLMLSLWL